MKTAIVYYSQSGNVAWAAKEIAARTGADLIPIEPETAYPDQGFRKYFQGGRSAVMGETPALKPYELAWDQYERIILGAPVWAAHMAPPLLSFVKENLDNLSAKQIALLACYSGAGAEKAMAKMKGILPQSEGVETLILTDPKDRPKAEYMAQIKAFYAAFTGEKH